MYKRSSNIYAIYAPLAQLVVRKPSAAGGRKSEAEEVQNKEKAELDSYSESLRLCFIRALSNM